MTKLPLRCRHGASMWQPPRGTSAGAGAHSPCLQTRAGPAWCVAAAKRKNAHKQHTSPQGGRGVPRLVPGAEGGGAGRRRHDPRRRRPRVGRAAACIVSAQGWCSNCCPLALSADFSHMAVCGIVFCSLCSCCSLLLFLSRISMPHVRPMTSSLVVRVSRSAAAPFNIPRSPLLLWGCSFGLETVHGCNQHDAVCVEPAELLGVRDGASSWSSHSRKRVQQRNERMCGES